MSLGIFKNLQIDEAIQSYYESSPLKQNTIFVLSLRLWFEYEADCAELYNLLTSEEIDVPYFRFINVELVTDDPLKLKSWMNRMSSVLPKYKNNIEIEKKV